MAKLLERRKKSFLRGKPPILQIHGCTNDKLSRVVNRSDTITEIILETI